MIPRYEEPEISAIWSDDYKFQTFLKVEVALLSALEEEKRIPAGVSKEVRDKSTINLSRIYEIEKTVHHDVVAFCSSISEQLPKKISKFFHFGVTSSDIIDTALSIQINASLELIEEEIKKTIESLRMAIHKTQKILTLGRSHGMYAEPMIFAQ